MTLDGTHLEEWLVRDDFNDLHHIATREGHVWIANTGFDRVDVFTQEGDFLRGYALTEASADASRPTPDDPYFAREDGSRPLHLRRLADRVHPNHVTFFEGRALVTRFSDRCVQDLTSWEIVIPCTPGYPHDGFVHGDTLWLTCTNGLVLGYQRDAQGGLRETERLDVFEASGACGWCRGLWVGEDVMLVGLTRITRMPRYRWCERPFEDTSTSVLVIDRRTSRLRTEIALEPFGQHPKLFSILEVNP